MLHHPGPVIRDEREERATGVGRVRLALGSMLLHLSHALRDPLLDVSRKLADHLLVRSQHDGFRFRSRRSRDAEDGGLLARRQRGVDSSDDSLRVVLL
jgi:hypothetical protein